MAKKDDLHVGDLVDGLRSFDKQHRVRGKIWQILNGPYIDVQLENGTIESMHVDDVHVLEAAKQAPSLDLTIPKVKEAVEYVVSRGYSQEGAESIVLEHGVEAILTSKAQHERERAQQDAAHWNKDEGAEGNADPPEETEKPKADAA
jgi:hypothetical protein